MRIWWCQEHESPLLTDEDMYGTRVQLCQLASWDETEIGPCRMVPMRLIPDNGEPVESHLLYWAWTIIANAGGGDWQKESPEWVGAAERWRDEFHAYLAAHPEVVPVEAKNDGETP